MADRPANRVRGEARIATPAPAATSSAEVQAANRFSQQLFGVASQGQDILDEIAVEDATIEGSIAGRNVNFQPRRDRTLSGRAYDKAARRSYGLAIETNARKQAAALFAEFGSDPAKLQDALTGYRVGAVEEINQSFPELAADFDVVYGRITAPLLKKSSDDFLAGVTARALGDSTDFIDTLGDDAARRAADMEAPEQSAVDVALERSRLVDHLTEHGPKTEFGIDGIQIGEDPDRVTLYSPKQIIEQLTEFDERMVSARMLGGVDAAIKGGAGVEYIRRFQETDAGLAPEFKDDLVSEMIGRLNRDHGLQAKAEQLDGDQRTARWADGEQQVTELFLAGDLDLETLQDMVRKDKLKPSLARTLSDQTGNSGPIADDGRAVLEYTIDPLAVEEDEILADTRLTFATRADLIDQRRKLVADDGNWRKTQNGQEGTRRIRAEFGLVSGFEALLDPELAKRAGRTLTEWFEAVEALPLEDRATKAVQMADDIIRQSKQSEAANDLSNAEAALEASKYQTFEQLDADKSLESFTGAKNEEYRIQKQQLEAKLRKIERLRREAAP